MGRHPAVRRGNDLIDALRVQPASGNRSLRLRLSSHERDNMATGPSRYVCEQGWATFESRLRTVIGAFIDKRNEGQNAGTPARRHADRHAHR